MQWLPTLPFSESTCCHSFDYSRKRSYDNKCSWLLSRGQFVFEWQCLLIVLCSCRYWFLFSLFFVFGIEILKKCDQNSWLECGIWLAKASGKPDNQNPYAIMRLTKKMFVQEWVIFASHAPNCNCNHNITYVNLRIVPMTNFHWKNKN
jgi:hypothetical protein